MSKRNSIGGSPAGGNTLFKYFSKSPTTTPKTPKPSTSKDCHSTAATPTTSKLTQAFSPKVTKPIFESGKFHMYIYKSHTINLYCSIYI